MQSVIPNTTQIPHLIIREWMPRLKDVELRVLLIITDQTLGWIEDKETGRRKEKDWISRGQLIKKTGRSAKHISEALKTLIDKLALVEAAGENGEALDTPQKRRMKFGKIFYRLTLRSPDPTLFDHPRVSKGHTARNQKILSSRVTKRPPQKGHTTKETVLQNNAKASELEKIKKLPTNSLLREFKEYSLAIRGQKPEFVRFKDGGLIKHALKHLSEGQIDMLFIWFLQEKRSMRPTIGAALCKEIIQSFIEASHREQGFYLKLEGLWDRYVGRKPPQDTKLATMQTKLEELKRSYFTSPFDPKERTAIQEEVARNERALKALV